MKRLIALLLCLMLTLGLMSFAAADELGSRVEDFSITLADGTQTTLYKLLEGKKGILLNFWASWCGYCMREFPEMQTAYAEYKDDIEILAVNVEPTDTVQTMLDTSAQLGLTMPMCLDEAGLRDRFGIMAYPTSVMIDRNGTLCFQQSGAFPSADSFRALFAVYTKEPYETKLLSAIPPLPYEGEIPAPEALAEALGADASIAVLASDETEAWPFVPGEGGVIATNGDNPGMNCALVLSVTCEEGQGLAYSLKMETTECYDLLSVSVDGTLLKLHSGTFDTAETVIPLPSAGAHEVAFLFERSQIAIPTNAVLSGVRIASGEDVAAAEAERAALPAVLEGSKVHIGITEGTVREVILSNAKPELYGSEDIFNVLTDPSYTALITLGPDVDPDMTYVLDGTGRATLLCHLPHNEAGYLYHRDDVTAQGTETLSVGSFVAELEGDTSLFFFTDPEAILPMMNEAVEAYGIDPADVGFAWRYADETEAANTADASANGIFTFLVTDEAGAPVEGVMLQLCDDSTCQLVKTDAEGKGEFDGGDGTWELHVLKVPDGYQKPGDARSLTPGGETVTIILTK